MFPKYLAIAFSALCLVLLALSSCSKKDGDTNGDDGDDGNEPYFIMDFRISAVSDSSVTLAWTATGDDADQGTASKYDIRYARTVITDDNWSAATQVIGEPSPKIAGSAESFEVVGLEEDSTYYFALETQDEAGNRPFISGCGPAACFTDFPVNFPDTALDHVVRAAIGRATGQLYRSDLMTLGFVDANQRNVSSLSGLEYCPELSAVLMSHNAISDLTPFTNLRKLFNVQLNVNDITDMSPLTNSNNIEVLMLRNNHVSDLAALTYNLRIHLLDLRSNNISDLSVLLGNLSFATNDTLYITGNPLSQSALDSQIPTLTARGVTVIN